MNKAECKNFVEPDEVREFPKGRLELLKIGGATVGRATFEPGWHWATCVQPIAKTESCQQPSPVPRFGRHASAHGQWRRTGLQRRDVSLLPSGHDAWVVGTGRSWSLISKGWWITPSWFSTDPGGGLGQASLSAYGVKPVG